MRAALLAALLAVLALLTGCASSPSVELSDWRLTSDLVAEKPVHLPAHLDADLPKRATTFTLRTRVTLPEALRRQTLTFEVPLLHARSVARIDGEQLPPLDPRMREGYRGIDQQAFHVPARLTERGAFDLELTVDYQNLLGSRLDVVPRISATTEGDAAFRFVRTFNEESASASAVVVFFTAFAYGLVFLRDRRRAAYGWFVLESTGAVYTLWQQGVLQALVGPYEQTAVVAAICIGEYASVQFTHALFRLGKPHPAWTWGTAAGVAATILTPSPFVAPFWIALVANVTTLTNVGYQTIQMVRVWRRDGPSFQVMAILLSWVFLAIVGGPDIVMWFGLGEIAGGLRGVSIGLAVMATMQVIVLSREHHDALVRAEQLNEELKHQIASRADTLAAALTRATSLGGAGRALEPGELLDGRYEIARRLGEGGAGIVYEVRRVADGERLALKLLHASADTTDMARFAREAQVIAKLDHPNVVRIVDVDVNSTGFFYIVVELVRGRSLREHRTRYGDVRWALRVLSQIADGLAAVHAQGVIHRDLKPANVLITEATESNDVAVRIADFGIAGQAGLRDLTVGSSGVTPKPDDLLLTATGAWIGTPLYMAPELADGTKNAARASDVFAFGLIACELLTGKLPYEGSAALRELKGERYEAPPSVRARVAGLPPEIADAIDACLAAEPSARPAARVLAETLRRYGGGVG
jgi:hypothetical protein